MLVTLTSMKEKGGSVTSIPHLIFQPFEPLTDCHRCWCVCLNRAATSCAACTTQTKQPLPGSVLQAKMAEAMAMAEFDGGIGESILFVPILIYCGISGGRTACVGTTAVPQYSTPWRVLCEGRAREGESREGLVW